MANLTPASEGIVTPEVYNQVRAALVSVLTPVLDGKVDTSDAIRMGTAALLEAVPAIRNLPDGTVLKVTAAALASIAAEVAEDLVVVFPDEVAQSATRTLTAVRQVALDGGPVNDPGDMGERNR